MNPETLILDYIKDCKTILDVGCGDGITLEEIRKAYPDKVLKGIDAKMDWDWPIYDTVVRRAREKGLDVESGNGMRMKFKDRSFDCVYCKALMVMVKKDVFKRTIREMIRVAKKRVVFIEPHRADAPIMGEYYWQDPEKPERTRLVANYEGHLKMLGYEPILIKIKGWTGEPWENWGHIIIVNKLSLWQKILQKIRGWRKKKTNEK